MDNSKTYRPFLSQTDFASDTAIIVYLALLKLAIHLFVNMTGGYGYFRDELYYIACSDHPAWGYVDQPPLSIFILQCVRWLGGDSLFSIRLLPAIAGTVVVVLTGLMVGKLGGGRFARILAGLTVLFAPVMLVQNLWFSMNAFDILLWTLASYIVIVIIKENKQSLWPSFGIVAGLGLMNKYSMGFLCIGLVAGLLLTSHRTHLTSRHFWTGVLISLLIFLPHVIWEVNHQFPSLEFMRNASQGKNVSVSVLSFFLGQLREIGFINSIIWLPGLFYFLFREEGRQYRLLGWMYVFIFAVMVASNAKVYYLSPIYPVFLASGAVFIEKLIQQHRWNWLKPGIVSLVIVAGIIVAPFALPLLSVDDFIRYQQYLKATPPQEEKKAMGLLPQHYADMFGWEGMVAGVAKAYNALTPEEQSQCALLTNNYGEAAAIDFFGQRYGLPKAISGHNNYWIWGPGGATGDVVIRLGGSLEAVRESYREVTEAGVFRNRYCMPYENNMPIYVCRSRLSSLTDDWPEFKHFE